MNSPKERILTVTAHLFHQQGYNSTGINQIIKEAKVAKASFYQHFESKEKLCAEFLNRRHTYWFNELSEYIEKEKSTRQKIGRAFDFIMDINKKENFRGCAFLNTLSEISPEQDNLRKLIQSHKADLKNLFKELSPNEATATHLYLLFESAIIESQLSQSNEIVKQSKSISNTIL